VTVWLVLGVILVGAAVALIVRAASLVRARTVANLGRIDSYSYVRSAAVSTEFAPTVKGLLDQLAVWVGGFASRSLEGMREGRLRVQLQSAGLYRMAPRTFVGYRVLSGLLVAGVWIWFGIAASVAPALVGVIAILAFFAGWSVPMVVIRRLARQRAELIDYELPELIDLLVVTVEAGLGFSGSLRMAADHLHGPLGDELRLTLQEQNMGLANTAALRNLNERCDTPGMRSFVRSVIQGESLGVSIGQIMRNLAGEMRLRRRQNAQERAQRAPVKLLFPLVFLIFPPMFIILLAPAAFSFIDAF
jgi:tight adherence protein C